MRFYGESPYEEFYVSFNVGDTTYNKVKCYINKIDIFDTYIYFIDIKPDTQYGVTLYVDFDFSKKSNGKYFFEDEFAVLGTMILEYDRMEKIVSAPLKKGEYTITDGPIIDVDDFGGSGNTDDFISR